MVLHRNGFAAMPQRMIFVAGQHLHNENAS
jgi:hypothetical protein